jgi:hypothetical protein
LRALSACGRLSLTRPTRPCVSTMMVWVVMARFPSRPGRRQD